MGKVQYVDPHIVDSDEVRRLKRISFTDRKFNESWFQNLLFDYPALLPTMDIEPAFSPCYSVARELPTKAGSIDLLYVSPLGYLTIAETKLIRNPEARREVVAQTLDYAKELSQWKYDDLIEAIRRTRPSPLNKASDPLIEIFKGKTDDEDLDPIQFQKSVDQCLRHGRFLLLIIGDRIREDVEWLVEYLQDFAHLQFTMGLIEIGLFRMDEKTDRPILVVPRVVARTSEIVRAIVRIEGDENLQKLPVVVTPEKEQKTSPSREAFWEAVRGKADAGVPGKLESLLNELEQMGLYVDPIESGIALRFPDPGESDTEFRLFRVTKEGRVRLGQFKRQLGKEGYNEEIAIRYLKPIAKWVGARVNSPKGDLEGKASDRMFPVKVLSEAHCKEYLELVRKTLDEIRAEAEKKIGSRSEEK
jgi:hypothetical protein